MLTTFLFFGPCPSAGRSGGDGGGAGARHPLRVPGHRRQIHQDEPRRQLLQDGRQGTVRR